MFKTLLNSATAIYTVFIVLVSCGGTASTKQQPAQQLSPATLPSIQVKALYPGADALTVLNLVASPLKDSIFQYAGNMDHMVYTAGSNGSLAITVYFTPGTNLDQAELNISNIVAAAKQLPSQVIQSGITVLKQNEPMIMAIDMYLEDARQYDQAFLADYTATHVVPEIRTIPGVSHLITLNENKDSLIRIWLDNDRMATFNLTLKELLAAVPTKQLEAVTGVLHKKNKPASDYIIKCKSERNQLAVYGNKVIHTNTDTILKLKDVAAKIEFGSYTYGNFARINNKPGISIIVMPLAGADYNRIQVAANKLMEKASAKFPAGVKHLMLYNPKDSLYISAE